MSKFILTLILSISLTGCDLISNQKNKIKWATVDKNKIITALTESFKKNNPAPAELGNEEETSRETTKIQNQISQLESDAREKCFLKTSNEKNVIKPGEVITYEKPSEGIKTIRNLSNKPISLSYIKNEPYSKEDDKTHACLSDISKDPLITDLRIQVNKFYEARMARSRHETEIRKKVDEHASSIIAKYAEANNFQMIVSNNYGGENILYNADKVSLNVTDDVIAFISKNQESDAKARQPISK